MERVQTKFQTPNPNHQRSTKFQRMAASQRGEAEPQRGRGTSLSLTLTLSPRERA